MFPIVGDRFREQLANEGIGDGLTAKTDVGQKLISKGLNSNSSYKNVTGNCTRSDGPAIKERQYFFDLHRDSARKNVTTKIIGDKSYAKLAVCSRER
ncbi:stage II sporulation protein P [Bacillus pacificus]